MPSVTTLGNLTLRDWVKRDDVVSAVFVQNYLNSNEKEVPQSRRSADQFDFTVVSEVVPYIERVGDNGCDVRKAAGKVVRVTSLSMSLRVR